MRRKKTSRRIIILFTLRVYHCPNYLGKSQFIEHNLETLSEITLFRRQVLTDLTQGEFQLKYDKIHIKTY